MNTTDFFCLSAVTQKWILLGLLSCFALAVKAETPAAYTFTRTNDLVLTLSDTWLDTETPSHGTFKPHSRAKNAQMISETSKTKAADIGCGMDVNPNVITDNSLTSRVVGECKFKYRY
ncbi:MAG: hypothetical protein PHH11_16345 [Methylomonas sp.]|nr:hypothetical protein [Methylomonas sp.]